MKRIIKWFIGIVLLNIQITAYSQNFINDNKEWAIVSTYSTKSNPEWTTYYKFMGDSTINGFSYHKLYKSTDSSQVNWALSYQPLWWERNDSVFLRGQGCSGIYLNDTTTLVYDFNLQEGDTFHINEYEGMKVDSIRFIEWGGSNRKHWYFNQGNTYGHTFWIEGVGQWGNFNYPAGCTNSLAESLLCFYEYGDVVYHIPSYTNCYVYTSTPSIAKSNEFINLYPNPATTQLTFTIPENSINATYTLYDMQGIPQLTGKTSNTQTELNVATLPRGLYILKIVTDKQTITKKVVRQ